jgi:hypothetical protein
MAQRTRDPHNSDQGDRGCSEPDSQDVHEMGPMPDGRPNTGLEPTAAGVIMEAAAAQADR